MMSGSILLSFALDVTPRFRDSVRDLSKEPGIKGFCSALGAELEQVEAWLGHALNEPSLDERLLRLLDQLEKPLQWPARFRPLHKSRSIDAFDRSWYPNLNRILTNRQWGKKNLKDFALSPVMKNDRIKLHRFLKGFDTPQNLTQGPELSELLRPIEQQEPQDDIHAYIKELHKVLSTNCLCQSEDYGGQIQANLRLNGYVKDKDDSEGVSFSLFFLDHPHQDCAASQCQWQDTQVHVLRTRAVRFRDAQDAAPLYPAGKRISMTKFCKIISNRQQSQLQLAASNGDLIFRGSGPLLRGFFLRMSSVALSRIIDSTKLSKKMRLLLSYQLAKAVWQFYDSDWMRSEWNKDTVHFMFEKRGKTPKGIFVNEPFLSTRFTPQIVHDDDGNDFRSHAFPIILALGVMFIEIELGVKIEDHYLPECFDASGRLTINANHIAASELLEKVDLWEESETFGTYKEVVRLCLNPDPFKPHASDPRRVRDALLKHVVNPLRVFYKHAWESPDTSEVRAIELDQASSLPSPYEHPHPRTYQLPDALTFEPAPNYDNMPGDTSFPSGAKVVTSSSERWFKQLQQLNNLIRCKPLERDDAYTPVKIAILDTGIAESYSRSQSIAGYKDFVEKGNATFQDRTGHGTNAFLLTQRVYGDAKIYAGRVWETNRANQHTASLMTEAIHHARQEWKVDIIAMPSGFPAENEDMLRAIEQANTAHVLVFAAAANHGNLAEIAFPARLYRAEKVFCMFSTNADARGTSNFNPSPIADARHSFAILGEDIVLGSQPPLSGTSYSTVVGAALAARVLDFARQADVRARMHRAGHLKRVEGMAAVFARMAVNDGGYRCIVPWKVLPSTMDEDIVMERAVKREWVCDRMAQALEDVYGA